MTLLNDTVKALGLFRGKQKTTNQPTTTKNPQKTPMKHQKQETPNPHPLPSSFSYPRQNCLFTTFLYPDKCQYKVDIHYLGIYFETQSFPNFLLGICLQLSLYRHKNLKTEIERKNSSFLETPVYVRKSLHR